MIAKQTLSKKQKKNEELNACLCLPLGFPPPFCFKVTRRPTCRNQISASLNSTSKMDEEERQHKIWNARNRERGWAGWEKMMSVFSKAGMRNQYLLDQSFHVYTMFINNNPVTYLI